MPIPLSTAQRMIEAALAQGNKMQLRLSVAIVDEAGFTIALARTDGALLTSPDIALSKAVASAMFRASTGDLEARWPATTPVHAFMAVRTGGRFMAIKGGLPVFEGQQIVGAVGVSGATADNDEEVARVAVQAYGSGSA